MELESPFFKEISDHDLKRIQNLLRNARSALWITRGGLLKGMEPCFNMINGVANALRVELATLRLSTIDLDLCDDLRHREIQSVLLKIMAQHQDSAIADFDREFRYQNGVLYFSRMTPEQRLNKRQAISHGYASPIESSLLKDLAGKALEFDLDFDGTSRISLLKEVAPLTFSGVQTGLVEIEVQAMGLCYEVNDI